MNPKVKGNQRLGIANSQKLINLKIIDSMDQPNSLYQTKTMASNGVSVEKVHRKAVVLP